jgi:hypothetical protein
LIASPRRLLPFLLSLLLCGPALAGERACAFHQGPSIDGNAFEPPAWPARLPASYFARPGIIRPGYDHFYLFIAWRALAGHPLAGQDQERIAPFDPCWAATADGVHDYQERRDPAMIAAREQWGQARAAAAAPALTLPDDEAGNCHADAFRLAARTLASRIASHGKGAALDSWVAAQDMVFANCASPASLPPDAGTGTPAWLRADRAYQQAAAAFYKGEHQDAARRFDAIAADPGSPWRALAPYLAARADMRLGDPAAMARARARLQPLAQAAAPGALRTDARRLLQLLQLRTEPAVLLADLDARLTGVDPEETIGQDLRDFASAYQRGEGSARADLAFAGWLSAMRGTGIDARQAAEKWQATHALPWLIAALTLATPDSNGVAQMLAAAAKLQSDSPAYLSARYHMARLANTDAAAVSIVERMLAQAPPSLAIEDANAFKRIGLARARTLAQVARFLPRTSAMPSENYVIPAVGRDGAALLNSGLPLDMLATLAQMRSVPPALRDELALVVWTRAFVLHRPSLAAGVARTIKAAIPAAAEGIDEMLAETDPVKQRALGAMLLARFPGMVGEVRNMNIFQTDPTVISLANMHRYTDMDSQRANWWYEFKSDTSLYGKIEPVAPPPRWLNQRQRRALLAERALLASTPRGAQYLANLVMAHARLHPRDPHLPAALAILIRANGADEAGVRPREMFRHLHRYFPRSEAARRTPTHR